MAGSWQRKIVHIDMDCFYAAIEVRDHPELRGKPVAVGGTRSRRGVLTTCNYEARQFGCRSAMPTYRALQLCPQLIVRPVRFDQYRAESQKIRRIFSEFTQLVEPLSLDEAYLDLSAWSSSGTALAWEIRSRIREKCGLTASAGIAPNKLLAKIASDWNKPDGQYEIEPDAVESFMVDLPISRIWGVGARTTEKLKAMGVKTCGDLQAIELNDLTRQLGKLGVDLHQRCRGIDDRPVEPSRERKSLSNERTFPEDLTTFDECVARLADIHAELTDDLRKKHKSRKVRSVFVKLKFSNFSKTTAERKSTAPDWDLYISLLDEAWSRSEDRGVRLVGAGVRFEPESSREMQLNLL